MSEVDYQPSIESLCVTSDRRGEPALQELMPGAFQNHFDSRPNVCFTMTACEQNARDFGCDDSKNRIGQNGRVRVSELALASVIQLARKFECASRYRTDHFV
jgi:hypothetical protein